MKTNKILALLLAVLMMVSIFAGCGEQNDSAVSSEAVSSVVASSEVTDAKNITVTVVHKDGSEKEFPIETEEQYLRGALDSLIDGEESEYGLYVLTVDGETADESNQEWWCLTQDGEMTSTGVDGIEIADGDHYELTLTVGY